MSTNETRTAHTILFTLSGGVLGYEIGLISTSYPLGGEDFVLMVLAVLMIIGLIGKENLDEG
jgi:hypothetical protein